MQPKKVSPLTFGSNLQRLMRARRIKNAALGREIGVSHVTIGHYLHGKFVPESATLKRLADFFRVSMEELLTGSQPYLSLRAAAALADKLPADAPVRQAAFERYAQSFTALETSARAHAAKLAKVQALLAEAMRILEPEVDEFSSSLPGSATPVPAKRKAKPRRG